MIDQQPSNVYSQTTSAVDVVEREPTKATVVALATQPIEAEEITKRKIGGTTYIVTSKYNENAREGLLDKLWWLIQNDER